MVILLNTICCGGKGLEKWNQIKNHILNSGTAVFRTNENGLIPKLKEYIEKGETHFVAAGGDGTVNYLLNILVEIAAVDQLKKITLGAIGIGSSNDFHKPFCSKIEGISVCIDFQNADYRDVGLITCETTNGEIEKYFLINASVGITAHANYLFNNSDSILSNLKRVSTKSAILYAAIKTILAYKNLTANITINRENFTTAITNLGITKNPHFSGDFCYDSPTDYTNGKFNVHLAYHMNKFEIVNLMKALIKGSFSKLKKTKSWQTDSIKIISKNKFAVEFDGEVVITNKVEFKILNKYIKVCSNGKNT